MMYDGRSPKSTNSAAAPTPVTPCASAAVAAVSARGALRRATIMLPRLMPSKNTSKISVKA